MNTSEKRRERRRNAHRRLRNRVVGTAERPRLAVFKSGRYLYAQIIDDGAGTTLAQANTRESEIRERLDGSTKDKAAARLVGETVAARAKERGIDKVVYDRGGYIFHGRVKELAAGARSQGLEF
jgi:large subunit ribosomal protein L18